MPTKTKLIDHIKNGGTITYLYLFLPFLIFFAGWLKIYIAIPLILLFAFAFIKVIKKLNQDKESITLTYGKKDLFAFIVILVWVYFSGVGGFVYQNYDWTKHNAIIAELINNDWPVILNFQGTDLVNIVESVGEYPSALMVYYIGFYLPSVAVAKLFGENAMFMAQILLYVWTVGGIFLIYRQLKHIFKSKAFGALIIFILFSGADALAYYGLALFDILPRSLSLAIHLEEWLSKMGYYYMQYSSNTTQLYWVPNQAVAGWLITLLIYRNRDDLAHVIMLTGLSIIFSPFVFIGLFPYALYLSLKMLIKKDRIKQLILLIRDTRFLLGIIFAAVFGLYLISNNSEELTSGMSFTFALSGSNIPIKALLLLLFYVVELGPFLFVIYYSHKRGKIIIADKKFLFLTVGLLIIWPLLNYGAFNDFTMRASIPALVILFMYSCRALLNRPFERMNKFIKIILIGIFSLAALTSIYEVNRALGYLRNDDFKLSEQSIITLDNDATGFSNLDMTLAAQYFDFTPSDNLFYKYFLKDSGEVYETIEYEDVDISEVEFTLTAEDYDTVSFTKEDGVYELSVMEAQEVLLSANITLEEGVYILEIPVDGLEVNIGSQSEYITTQIVGYKKTIEPLKKNITRILYFYVSGDKEIELQIFNNETEETTGYITFSELVLTKVVTK